MIYKVIDRNRIIHYNVLGFRCPVTLCRIEYVARSVLSVSWKRSVDCMTCLVRAASLPWCGHGSGQIVRVDPQYDGYVRRQCHRCSDNLPGMPPAQPKE